jgi:tetratricopeptide (TPR) repeat protein
MRSLVSLCALVLLGTSTAAGQRVRVTESIEVLEQRARADSNDAAAHYNVAMGYWSKKRYDDAEHSLRQAIQIDPEFADAYLALGIVHNWDGHYWDQIRHQGGDSLVRSTFREWNRYSRKAFLIDPLVDVKILGATYKFGLLHDHFRDGLESLVEGHYDQAFDNFDRELKNEQGNQPMDSVSEGLIWLHGLAAAHLNQYEAASSDFSNLFSRATRQESNDSTTDAPLETNDYRYMLAVLDQRMGKTEESIRLYQEVAQNDLGNFMAHVQLARIYEGTQRWDFAVIERRRAVETNPDDANLLTDLGITLGRAGQFQEALDVLKQSEQANPRDCRPLFWLGTAALQLNQRDTARDAFTRFVALAPSRYARQLEMARQRLTELQ